VLHDATNIAIHQSTTALNIQNVTALELSTTSATLYTLFYQVNATLQAQGTLWTQLNSSVTKEIVTINSQILNHSQSLSRKAAGVVTSSLFVLTTADETTNDWVPSRSFAFNKVYDSTISVIKLTWFDSIRCLGNGVQCGWKIYLDRQPCRFLHAQMYNGPSSITLNIHVPEMLTGYCKTDDNGKPLNIAAGRHMVEVYEGPLGVSQHGTPMLGFPLNEVAPGVNTSHFYFLIEEEFL
jgi:hypothetical protein